MLNIDVDRHRVARHIELLPQGSLARVLVGEGKLELRPLAHHPQLVGGRAQPQAWPAARQAVRQQEEPLDAVRHLGLELV